MKLKIVMTMDNAAFEEENGGSGTEAARILRKIADRIDGENCTVGDVTPCMDINGNRVGEAKVTA
jgi:hypothetical protein